MHLKCSIGLVRKLVPVLLLLSFLQPTPSAFAEDKKHPLPKLLIDEKPLPADLKKETSFAPVIKRVAPSVINIYSTTTVKERGFVHPFLNDPLFRRFFGDNGGTEKRRPRTEQSLGSGVIVSSDGYVLTASHVVDGADKVKVSLAGGDQEYDARIIGIDSPTDIAVLKLEIDKTLPAVTLADSEKLEVGDMVLALGNPFGVGQTVTMGIISAVGRGGFGITGYENFIQTDAAINPGNSGGALVDASGRLVGINTAIVSGSGGFMGVGFAVPVNMARFVMERLITEGKVNRGYLGISIQPLTSELAKAFNLPDERGGVLVGGVTRGSGAEKGGMKDGDVIVELNGKKVTEPRTLQLLVAEIAPGSKVAVRVLRGQHGQKPQEKTLTIALGTLPDGAFAREREDNSDDQTGEKDALDGVEVVDLDSRSRRQFEIPENIKGALVVTVDPDSNSAEAGLRPGDVLTQIDRKPVQNANDAVTLSENADGDKILLRVWTRNAGGNKGGTRYVVVENKKKK
jgi:serine protease Do